MSGPRIAGTAGADEARYAIATDWLQRLDQPELGEEEMQRWLEWFGSSDLNRTAFEEASRLRQRLRQLPDADRRLLLRGTAPMPVRRGGRVRRWGKMLAAAAALVVMAVIPGQRRIAMVPAAGTVHVSPAGEFRSVALEDGSALVLGADAEVSVAYSGERRTLDIRRGAAYFEVRRDVRRPFEVYAAGIKVTAVGTAFKVSRLEDRVVVTVTEGVVEVAQARHAPGIDPEPLRLEMGQRREIALAAVADPPSDPPAMPMPSWRDGRVEFVNRPLGDVVSLVNRHAPVRITIEDPRVERLTYSGTVEGPYINEWIASLPHVYAIRVVKLDDGTVALVSSRGPVDR